MVQSEEILINGMEMAIAHRGNLFNDVPKGCSPSLLPQLLAPPQLLLTLHAIPINLPKTAVFDVQVFSSVLQNIPSVYCKMPKDLPFRYLRTLRRGASPSSPTYLKQKTRFPLLRKNCFEKRLM